MCPVGVPGGCSGIVRYAAGEIHKSDYCRIREERKGLAGNTVRGQVPWRNNWPEEAQFQYSRFMRVLLLLCSQARYNIL